jgi:hypothetical protein
MFQGSSPESASDVRYILDQAHFAQHMLEAAAQLFVNLSDARTDVDRGVAVEAFSESIKHLLAAPPAE